MKFNHFTVFTKMVINLHMPFVAVEPLPEEVTTLNALLVLKGKISNLPCKHIYTKSVHDGLAIFPLKILTINKSKAESEKKCDQI